ncbi:MAG: SDR family NAD(P)-dependent oxidoreductase [Clostridia bacterium]|nr:SDR family NAD(P)-dependent oxidoreductase [Clostridia bacterium]
MKYKLNGKVAVITGASRGIGLEIARALDKEGAIVYDISRNFAANPEVKMTFTADVNDGVSVEKILKMIFEKEGKIDIFVNNAGFGIGGAVESASKENLYAITNTNLAAVMNLSRLAMPYLKKSKGRLVNISSVGGIVPLPYQAAYSATKAGVEIFSKALANEVRADGVQVMCILPGDAKTSFTAARIVETKEGDERAVKAIKKAENEEQKGMSAQKVGRIIVANIKKRKMPLRKTIGGVYKLIILATRLVSTRFLNWLVRKIYI